VRHNSYNSHALEENIAKNRRIFEGVAGFFMPVVLLFPYETR